VIRSMFENESVQTQNPFMTGHFDTISDMVFPA